MTRMLFKLQYTVRDLTLSPEAALMLDFGGSHGTKVEVRPPTQDERSLGHKSQHAFCNASCVVEPSGKVRAVFAEITADEIMSKYGSDFFSTEYTTPDGTQVRLPPLAHFPEYFRSFVKNISDELRDVAVRTVSVLRWRTNELGPHDPFSSRGLHWSIDGSFWHPMPADHTVQVTVVQGLSLSKRRWSEIDEIVRAGGGGPLHHDLFREAWQRRYENPRSSLIIGMAAAELSLKHCISTLVPNAAWLAMNVPSPPLIQMLREYLPKLPAKCKISGLVKPPPKAVLDDLKKGIAIRNQVSHAGAASPSGDTVETVLLSVHDLLWLVDFYVGYEWALDFLRPETSEALAVA